MTFIKVTILIIVIGVVFCLGQDKEIPQTSEAVVSKRQDNTEEGPSVKDLEDSFGGTEHSVDVKQEAAPSTPRTGFYFLADWNSFLDVDDQLGRRVNLRFQPTIGDPKRFLSVTVP